MKFLIYKDSGFCFGVGRAVEKAFELKGNNNYVLGEIIHNEIVNKNLEDNGVKTIYNLDEVSLGSNDTVLIRTVKFFIQQLCHQLSVMKITLVMLSIFS